MAIVITFIVFILAIALDFVPLVKRRRKREYIVYGVIFSVGFSVLFMIQLGVKMPDPTVFIRQIIEVLTPSSISS